MDVNEARLVFCKQRLGVTDTIVADGSGAELELLQQATQGQLADVVIDATGNNLSMSRALNFCAFGGRLVYVGITSKELSFPHAPVMHRRQLSLLASRNALSRDFARIIELIEDGRINTTPWITHRARFDDMIAEFPKWLRPESQVIKAMVSMA
jgi:alcohol dehydrogenase